MNKKKIYYLVLVVIIIGLTGYLIFKYFNEYQKPDLKTMLNDAVLKTEKLNSYSYVFTNKNDYKDKDTAYNFESISNFERYDNVMHTKQNNVAFYGRDTQSNTESEFYADLENSDIVIYMLMNNVWTHFTNSSTNTEENKKKITEKPLLKALSKPLKVEGVKEMMTVEVAYADAKENLLSTAVAFLPLDLEKISFEVELTEDNYIKRIVLDIKKFMSNEEEDKVYNDMYQEIIFVPNKPKNLVIPEDVLKNAVDYAP